MSGTSTFASNDATTNTNWSCTLTTPVPAENVRASGQSAREAITGALEHAGVELS